MFHRLPIDSKSNKFIHSYLFQCLVAVSFFIGWYFGLGEIGLATVVVAVVISLIFTDDGAVMGSYFLYAMFTFAMFPYFNTIPWYLYAEIGVYVAGIIAFLVKRIITHNCYFNFGSIGLSLVLLLVTFFAATLVRQFTSTNLPSEYNNIAYITCGLFALLVLFYFVFHLTTDEGNEKLVYKTFYIVNILVLAELFVVIPKAKFFDEIFILTRWGSKNTVAIVLEMCIPFVAFIFAKNKWRIDALLIIAVDLYFVTVSDSRGGIISIAVLIPLLIHILLSRLKDKKYIYPTVLVSIVVTVFVVYESVPSFKESIDRLIALGDNLSGRWDIWKSALEYAFGKEGSFSGNIYFGGGVQALFDLFPIYGFGYETGSIGIWLCHNTVITVLCASGFVGAAMFIYHMVEIFVANYKAKMFSRTALLYFVLIGVIHGIIDNTFFNIIYLVPYIWIFSLRGVTSFKLLGKY